MTPLHICNTMSSSIIAVQTEHLHCNKLELPSKLTNGRICAAKGMLVCSLVGNAREIILARVLSDISLPSDAFDAESIPRRCALALWGILPRIAFAPLCATCPNNIGISDGRIFRISERNKRGEDSEREDKLIHDDTLLSVQTNV